MTTAEPSTVPGRQGLVLAALILVAAVANVAPPSTLRPSLSPTT